MIKKIFKSRTFYILLSAFLVLFVRHIICERNSYYMPEYEYVKIRSDSTDDEIFRYCGLSGKAAREIDEESLSCLNKLYFEKPDIKKEYILFPFTAEERVQRNATPIAPLKKGDILITFNTATLDWRHGHAAIVTDADKGIILEHMSVGNNSILSYASKWGKYAAFAVLRHPDEKLAGSAAEYAKEHLTDIPYSIFAGIIKKDMSKEEKIKSSHCSHIVWQAYKAVGEDIDQNGGILVTPKDIAKSDKLKVVQIFGLNPDKYKDRILK